MMFILIATILVVVQCTDYSLSVDVANVIATKPTPYYGFTIDWWTKDDPRFGIKWGNAGALTVDFTNENFIALVSAISPAFLRIGGSPEDSIIYNISGACLDVNASLPGYSCSQTNNNYGCMNISRWQQINDFAVKTNTTLLFGLNGCYGRPSSNASMNFSNIAGLLEATVNDIDSHSNLFGFELANELNKRIDADTYAADFITLHKIIQSTFTGKAAPIPYLVGADVGALSYSEAVVEAIQDQSNNHDVSGIMHSLTYHHYPNCNYPGNGTVYDLQCIDGIHSAGSGYAIVSTSGNTMSWMGEGSEHTGGGTQNISDTFVDCFYYLYQLCDVLAAGASGTMRSDLIGADYQLIDKETFLPNPSYWILYLFKMFVGDTLHTVFGVFGDGNVRAFAFNGVGENGNNQVVLVLINFDLNENAVLNIKVNDGADGYNAEEYHLKSGGAHLNANVMMVNDVKMEYVNGKFPKIESVKGEGTTVALDPATLAFVVLTPQ